MLLVRAKAGLSKIHGIGLIAQEFIPTGTMIWRFTPGFDVTISDAAFRELSTPAQEQVIHYAYYSEESRALVLSSDDDRFTNHSDDSNTRLVGDDAVADRDIFSGEEITTDYRELYRAEEHFVSKHHFRKAGIGTSVESAKPACAACLSNGVSRISDPSETPIHS